jgi:hypothetical protein
VLPFGGAMYRSRCAILNIEKANETADGDLRVPITK